MQQVGGSPRSAFRLDLLVRRRFCLVYAPLSISFTSISMGADSAFGGENDVQQKGQRVRAVP